jgi:hypothetical protein
MVGDLSTNTPPPTLIFSQGAYIKMMTYINGLDTEIGGFMYVDELGPGRYYVHGENDVFITAQTVTLVTTDADVNFALAYDHAFLAGRHDEMRLQWHKHPSGMLRFSGHDLANIEGFAAAGMTWFISLVAIADGGVRARLDNFHPRVAVEMQILVELEGNDVLDWTCADEIERLVTVEELPPEETDESDAATLVVVGSEEGKDQ